MIWRKPSPRAIELGERLRSLGLMKVLPSSLRLAYAAVRRLSIIDVTRLLHLSQDEMVATQCPSEYRIRTVNSGELARLIAEEQIDGLVGNVSQLDDSRRALIAAYFGDEVVSFMWLAKDVIEGEKNYSRSEHLGTSIDMPDGTAFIYNAWTSPNHRGKRLIGAMMTWAILNRVLGASSLVTMIDWTNAKSIRAFEFVGMKQLGSIARIGRPKLQFSLVPGIARRFGCRVAESAPGMKLAW